MPNKKRTGGLHQCYFLHSIVIIYFKTTPLITSLVKFQVDTNLESPNDIVVDGVPGIGVTYNIAPYSSILLEAK